MEKLHIYDLHQPTFLNPVSIFDLHNYTHFLNKDKSMMHYDKKVFQLKQFLDKVENTKKTHHLLIGGKILQKLRSNKDVVRKLRILTKNKIIQPVGETLHKSLSHLISTQEFLSQVQQHKKLCTKVFGQAPVMYVDETNSLNKNTAKVLEGEGFKVVISNNVETPGTLQSLQTYQLHHSLQKIKDDTKPKPSKDLVKCKTQATLKTKNLTLNTLQSKALTELKNFEDYLKTGKQEELLHIWKALTCKHVFTTMCNVTDNTQHDHPHNSAYEVHITFMNILNGLAQGLLSLKQGQPLNKPKIYNKPSALLS